MPVLPLSVISQFVKLVRNTSAPTPFSRNSQPLKLLQFAEQPSPFSIKRHEVKLAPRVKGVVAPVPQPLNAQHSNVPRPSEPFAHLSVSPKIFFVPLTVSMTAVPPALIMV